MVSGSLSHSLTLSHTPCDTLTRSLARSLSLSCSLSLPLSVFGRRVTTEWVLFIGSWSSHTLSLCGRTMGPWHSCAAKQFGKGNETYSHSKRDLCCRHSCAAKQLNKALQLYAHPPFPSLGHNETYSHSKRDLCRYMRILLFPLLAIIHDIGHDRGHPRRPRHSYTHLLCSLVFSLPPDFGNFESEDLVSLLTIYLHRSLLLCE